jgi:hypothetical protein
VIPTMSSLERRFKDVFVSNRLRVVTGWKSCLTPLARLLAVDARMGAKHVATRGLLLRAKRAFPARICTRVSATIPAPRASMGSLPSVQAACATKSKKPASTGTIDYPTATDVGVLRTATSVCSVAPQHNPLAQFATTTRFFSMANAFTPVLQTPRKCG